MQVDSSVNGTSEKTYIVNSHEATIIVDFNLVSGIEKTLNELSLVVVSTIIFITSRIPSWRQGVVPIHCPIRQPLMTLSPIECYCWHRYTALNLWLQLVPKLLQRLLSQSFPYFLTLLRLVQSVIIWAPEPVRGYTNHAFLSIPIQPPWHRLAVYRKCR